MWMAYLLNFPLVEGNWVHSSVIYYKKFFSWNIQREACIFYKHSFLFPEINAPYVKFLDYILVHKAVVFTLVLIGAIPIDAQGSRVTVARDQTIPNQKYANRWYSVITGSAPSNPREPGPHPALFRKPYPDGNKTQGISYARLVTSYLICCFKFSILLVFLWGEVGESSKWSSRGQTFQPSESQSMGLKIQCCSGPMAILTG